MLSNLQGLPQSPMRPLPQPRPLPLALRLQLSLLAALLLPMAVHTPLRYAHGPFGLPCVCLSNYLLVKSLHTCFSAVPP